jgi:flagellar biosynthetic protein FliO
VHTRTLSLIALVVLTLSGQAVGQADQPIDPNDPNFQAKSISPANPDTGTPPEVRSSLDVPNLFPRMILSLVLVMGLGVAAFFLSKKVLPRVARGSAKEIRIVETVYLGPRKALHLVEIGHRKLLIGSTSESITPLATVGDEWLDVPKPPADDLVSL